MQRKLGVLVASIMFAGCTDSVAPPPGSSQTGVNFAAARTLTAVSEGVLASRDVNDLRTLTIGVLDRDLTDTSAIVVFKFAGETERQYDYRRRSTTWLRFAERPIERSSVPRATADLWEYPVASLTRGNNSTIDLYHPGNAQPGAYVVHKYVLDHPGYYPGQQISTGNWAGGAQWVNGNLLTLEWGHWDYSNNSIPCQWGPKSSTQRSASFTYMGCGAGEVHLWYSITTAVSLHAEFSSSSPTSITSASTYTWTVNASGGSGGYSFAWEKSTDGGDSWSSTCSSGSQCSQSVSYGDPSFVLRATVSSNGNTVQTTRTVSVHIPGPNDPTPPTVNITGPWERADQEEGSWTASLSNSDPLANCDWYVDGTLMIEAGSCTYSDSWGDGYRQHVLTAIGHAAIDYPGADFTVTVTAPMECGPEGCMARRKKLQTSARPTVVAKKAPLIRKP